MAVPINKHCKATSRGRPCDSGDKGSPGTRTDADRIGLSADSRNVTDVNVVAAAQQLIACEGPNRRVVVTAAACASEVEERITADGNIELSGCQAAKRVVAKCGAIERVAGRLERVETKSRVTATI